MQYLATPSLTDLAWLELRPGGISSFNKNLTITEYQSQEARFSANDYSFPGSAASSSYV